MGATAQVTGTGVYDFEFSTGSNYWSPELKAIAGLSEDSGDISLERMTRIAHPEDRERFMQEVEASLDPRGDGHLEDEYRLLRPDGSLRWVRVRGRTFFAGQAGKRRVLGASGIVIDITEQKLAEEKLRASEERYRALFANMTEAFALGEPIFDGQGNPVDLRLLEANDAFYVQSGLPRGNLGRPVREYVPIVEQSWVDCYAEVATTGQAIRLQNYNAGTRRHYDVYAYSPNPGQFAILFRDITEQRDFQEELKKFKFFSDLSSDGHLIGDTKGRIRYANRALCETLGYSEEEILGLRIQDIAPSATEDLFWEIVERTKAGGMPHFESTRRRKDGSLFPVEISATALEVKGEWLILSVGRDITDRKAAEAQIQALNAELESRVRERTAQLQESNEALLKSNTELKHFAHATAHDLQTPLRSIAGFTQLLQKEVQGRGDERIDEWSATVVNNTRRLQILIQDILSYARLEIEGLPFQVTDFRKLFDEVVDSLTGLIGETQAEVSCSALPALPVDRTQIALVFQNLIENGIKYNRSKPPRVAISGEQQGDQWVFSVVDNGIGIDRKHFDRIFELFQRLHTYHQFPGTGIGLSLCRRIVERHGGHIWIDSQPGQGSTFYFSLPVGKSEGL